VRTPRRPPTSRSRSSDTKQRILDVAIELFAARGFHESSMRDIAARVGIEAPSLYAHYASKEAILRTILEGYRREVAALRLPDEALERIVSRHSTEAILVEGFKAIRKGVSAERTQRIMRLLFNEIYRNPLVAAFGLDVLRRTNLREIARIFAVMQRHGKLRPVRPRTASVAYNALVNNYFQELFALEACGRSTRGVEMRTLEQVAMLARLLSPAKKESSSC
jgi:AcrR family transcriptional regulator